MQLIESGRKNYGESSHMRAYIGYYRESNCMCVFCFPLFVKLPKAQFS